MASCHTLMDTLQVEKANAIARYKLAKLLQVFELVMVLTLLTWSSSRLPAAFQSIKISGKYVLELFPYILKPHIIFLIGNAIVVALYLLSRRTVVENSSDISGTYSGETERRLPIAATESTSLSDEIIAEEEKEIVWKEKLSSERESVRIEVKPKLREKFRRSMSENSNLAKPRKELGRSETDVGGVAVTWKGQMSRYETVEMLSSEEFRLRVEGFIEKQQKLLRQQKYMAEIES